VDSFLNADDIHHNKATVLFKDAFDHSKVIYVPDLILAEILNVSFRVTADTAYVQGLAREMLNLQPNVKVVAGDGAFWLSHVPKSIAGFKLKTLDAIICCYLGYLGIHEFVSFDKKLTASAKTVLP